MPCQTKRKYSFEENLLFSLRVYLINFYLYIKKQNNNNNNNNNNKLLCSKFYHIRT